MPIIGDLMEVLNLILSMTTGSAEINTCAV